MASTVNFEFLSVHDPKLAELGALAERYFRDDPPTCLFKVRQLAEQVAKLIAAHHALYSKDRETFEERLRRLHYDRIIPREINEIFHKLRILGNAAAHEAVGGHSEALTGLKLARELAVWFHRTYGKNPKFAPGAFIPPQEPVDDTAKLRAEIESQQRRIVETQKTANRASQAAADKASALESAEERLRREAEERAVWEQLAQELEAEKNQLTARLARHEEEMQIFANLTKGPWEGRARTARSSAPKSASSLPSSARFSVDGFENEDEVEIETTLATLQAVAENSPKAETRGLIERGEEAAAQIDLDEASTRALIDQQLRDSGWDADTKTLRFASGSRPVKGKNLAIAEWPTDNGPADYALFAGLTLVGVEAYDEIIKIAPNYAAAKNGKAAILVVRGEFAAALVLLPTHPPATRDDWIAWHIRGMSFLRKGELDLAIDCLEKGRTETPFAREKRYFERALGIARMRKGEFKEAIEVLKEIGGAGLSNVLRLHAHAAIGRLTSAKAILEELSARCPVRLVELKDAIVSRFGLGARQPEHHNDNWIFNREAEALLQDVA